MWPFNFQKSITLNFGPQHVEFQLGRYLYDAQVLHADVVAGKEISPDRIKQLCERYCRLVNHVGLFRYDYGEMMDLLKKVGIEIKIEDEHGKIED